MCCEVTARICNCYKEGSSIHFVKAFVSYMKDTNMKFKDKTASQVDNTMVRTNWFYLSCFSRKI